MIQSGTGLKWPIAKHGILAPIKQGVMLPPDDAVQRQRLSAPPDHVINEANCLGCAGA